MKRIFCLIILSCCFLAAEAQSNGLLGLDIRVATSNVRYNTKNDGENIWDNRKERLADALLSINADVIGTQEALYDQKVYLQKRLKGYKVVGIARDDGKKKGEHSAIFYNKKRFKAIKCGNFWLSETPDVPSKGWDAACIRIATWAFLQEKSTGKKFFFVNTHLDHAGVQARREGVSLLCRKAAEIGKGCPMVITGDFNFYLDSDDAAYLKDIGLLHAYDIAEEKKLQLATWHGYEDMEEHVKHIDHVLPQIIDYILINRGTCSHYEITDPKGPDGGFLSDHCPVFADITL